MAQRGPWEEPPLPLQLHLHPCGAGGRPPSSPFPPFIFSRVFFGLDQRQPPGAPLGGCWRLGVLASPLRPLLHHRAPRGPLLMGRIQAKPGSWRKIAIFYLFLFFLAALALNSRNAISSGVNGAAPPPALPSCASFLTSASRFAKKQPEKGCAHTHTHPGHIQAFILRGSLMDERC